MSIANRIAKNTTVLLIATFISYLFGFFTTLFIARYLGAEGFGVISLALALTAIFGIFTDLGLSTLTVREVARNRTLASKYVINITLIKLILSLITFIFLILTTKIIGYSSQENFVIYLIGFYMIFGSFSGIFYSIFQSYEKMEYQSVGTIINAVLMLLGVLIAVYYHLNIIAFAIIYVIVSLVVLIYNLFIYSWKFKLPRNMIDLSFWKPTIILALPFGITGIFTMIYFWIDSVILSIMVGNEVVGWYNAAYRLIFIFISLYSVYMVSIFPIMSKFYETSKKSIKLVYERSFKFLLIISLPLAVFTTLMADKIILIIYGTGYIPSIIALQILIWSIVFMFVNNLSLNLLGSVNRPLVVAKIIASGAIINIILNILLIPKLSYIGSSASTVITELVMIPIFIHILLRTGYAETNAFIKDLPKILLCNVVMAVIIIYIKNFNILLTILIAFLVYVLMIYLTKTLDSEDFMLLKNLFKRNKN